MRRRSPVTRKGMRSGGTVTPVRASSSRTQRWNSASSMTGAAAGAALPWLTRLTMPGATPPQPPASSGQLEVGDRTAQVRGELGQVADRLGRLAGTHRGLRGDLLNHVHRRRDVGRGGRLLARGLGDVLNQVGEVVRHLLDLAQ